MKTSKTQNVERVDLNLEPIRKTRRHKLSENEAQTILDLINERITAIGHQRNKNKESEHPKTELETILKNEQFRYMELRKAFLESL